MNGAFPRLQRIVIAALLSLAVLFAVCPHPRDTATPLPWDMAAHVLGGVDFVDAVRSGSPEALGSTLLAQDYYPPGHSVALGAWILVAGESPRSLWLFRWILLALCVLAVLELASASGARSPTAMIVAAGLWLASPYFLGLSASLLVEPHAIALLLWSLVAINALNRRPDLRHLVMASLLVLGVLLSKYNVGLPLLPILALLTLWRLRAGRKRVASMLALCAGIAAVGWILFLSLQTQGWTSFLLFVRNRSDSEDWSALARLVYYIDTFVRQGVSHPAVAVLLTALACSLALRPRPRGVIVPCGLLYIFLTLLSLSRHPYLLSRNLSAAMAVFGMLAAIAAARWVDRRMLRWREQRGRIDNTRFTRLARSLGGATCALALVLAALAIAPAREKLHSLDPPQLAELRPLSLALQQEFVRSNEVLVLGTFNEFSPAWVQLLRRRTGRVARIHIELPPPGGWSPDRIEAGYQEEYETILSEWRVLHPYATLFAIQLSEDSCWWSHDYELRNRWKLNWSRALQESEHRPAHDEHQELSPGLRVSCFSDDASDLRYVEGWGQAAEWGRWAMNQRATLWIVRSERIRYLKLEAAPFEEMQGKAQSCRIRVGNQAAVEWLVEGRPWQWQGKELTIHAGFEGKIDLEFAHRWPAGPNAIPRALPFRPVVIEESQDLGRDLVTQR